MILKKGLLTELERKGDSQKGNIHIYFFFWGGGGEGGLGLFWVGR